MGCIESAFLIHASPSVNSFVDEDLPALNLFLQYLTQLEGPMWKKIRGAGLAYGYHLSLMPHESLLYLTLYKATNVTAAFKETKIMIVRVISKTSIIPHSHYYQNLGGTSSTRCRLGTNSVRIREKFIDF